MIDYTNFRKILNGAFEKHAEHSVPTEEQSNKLYRITEYLFQENEKYNLTAIRSPEDAVIKHIFDTIIVEKFIPNGSCVIDVGSGAGFPAVPLAIMRSDITVTALDSTEKKTEYIKKVCGEFGIKNVKTLCARAEEASQSTETREKYDVAIARSVAGLPILTELCLPFVKKGGRFISMKSGSARHEIEESANAIAKLGGAAFDVISLYTSGEDERCLFISGKVSNTPNEYPRRYAQIKKKPL